MGRATSVASLGLAALVLWAAPARGQEPVDPILSGRLLRAGVAADSGTVVLHRYRPDEVDPIMPVDSTGVGSDGAFRFRLPGLPVPESDSYFLTSRYDGVSYLSRQIAVPVQLDSVQFVEVFPAEEAPPVGLPFPIYLREIILAEGPLGWSVSDFFVLQSGADMTYVASAADGVVWSYPLPAGAIAPRVVEVLPVPGAVRIEDGRIVAANPILPGINSYVVQYDLESLPLELPMPGTVLQVGLYVREPGPAIRVEGLAARGPRASGGATFRVWDAVNLENQTIRAVLGEEGGRSAVSVWLTTLLALFLVGAGTWVTRRGVASGRGPRGRLRKDVLVEVARLDEAFQAAPPSDEAGRELYRRRRSELLKELESPAAPTATR